MLGKLFAHEMRSLWKPAAIMLAVMVAAGIAGIAAFGSAMAVSDAAGYGSGYVTGAALAANATVVLFLGALFCGFLVWAAIAALYLFVVMRFYRTMFTDEGYLTLTLPVRAGTLVMAKFWAAYLLLTVFAFTAMGLYAAMVAVVGGGDMEAVAGVLSLTAGWFAFTLDGGAAGLLLAFVNTLITCAYALGLAFASLTLGAWWAHRHKVAAAVGIYLGFSWVVSFLFSAASVLAMTGNTGSWNAMLGAVSLVQLMVNIGVIVGSLALSAHLVRTKVDLS
ncbi:hypothetical protein [uncultured Adlercreutzia sp.]|uniref:hypothetical protein n=1 Tax=uncultured Adlercreutzia sp. TaxID=875803 RepID=UPI002676100D|nr:hypothetical protein [uncultured Adlercreutzia sp.]